MKATHALALLLGGAAMASRDIEARDSAPEVERLEARQRPINAVIFVCNLGMEEVCTNMCYGAYCKSIGEALEYDKPDAKTKRDRRKAAGCIASGGNRCSVNKGYKEGFHCDEYPFASTVPVALSNVRLTRCVPAAQNRKQGGILSAFYRNPSWCNGGPCSFAVKMGNARGIRYCNAAWGAFAGSTPSVECGKGDRNQVVGPGGLALDDDFAGDGTDDADNTTTSTQSPEPEKRQLGRSSSSSPSSRARRLGGAPVYKLSSGLELDVPGGLEVGQRAFVVMPRNLTLWEEHANYGDPELKARGLGGGGGGEDEEDEENFDYMLENLEVRDETVVSEIL